MAVTSNLGFSFEFDEYCWVARVVSATGVVKTIELNNYEIAWWLPGGAVEVEDTKTGIRRTIPWEKSEDGRNLISFSSRREIGLTNIANILSHKGCFRRLLQNK